MRAEVFERAKGKRRCVTQNDLLIEAVEQFLRRQKRRNHFLFRHR